MLEVLIRYLHFIAILAMFSALVAEHLLIKAQLSGPELRRLAIVDAIYGVSALLVLTAGLLLWFWVGKPADFYTGNPVFHAKLSAFILVALLSVYPTVFFLRHRKASGPVVEVPRRIVLLIRIQLTILLLIPLLAVLMARGYGLPS